MTPKELAIEITNLLKTVTQANGYLTDIGLSVYRGRLNFEDSNVPCAVLGEAPDEPVSETEYGNHITLKQKFIIDAYVACERDNPNDAAHDAIADLKKVFFTGVNATGMGGALSKNVRRIRYLGRSIGPRADGALIIRGSVSFELLLVERLTNS